MNWSVPSSLHRMLQKQQQQLAVKMPACVWCMRDHVSSVHTRSSHRKWGKSRDVMRIPLKTTTTTTTTEAAVVLLQRALSCTTVQSTMCGLPALLPPSLFRVLQASIIVLQKMSVFEDEMLQRDEMGSACDEVLTLVTQSHASRNKFLPLPLVTCHQLRDTKNDRHHQQNRWVTVVTGKIYVFCFALVARCYQWVVVCTCPPQNLPSVELSEVDSFSRVARRINYLETVTEVIGESLFPEKSKLSPTPDAWSTDE